MYIATWLTDEKAAHIGEKMDNAVFIGTYSTRSDALKGLFPSQSESGLWHVWQMPDNTVMLQGLSVNHEPVGSLFLMQQEIFTSSTEMFAGPPVHHGMIHAGAPDLLALWYQQAVTETPGNAGGHDFNNESTARVLPNNADLWLEMMQTPVFAPEISGEQQAAPAHAPAKEIVVPAISSPIPSPQNVQQTEGPSFAFLRKTEETPPLSITPFDETRAGIVEQAMRTEFSSIMERLRQEDPVDIVRELESLIMRRDVLTWRQKFMFTEFGLALRRERQYEHALACHFRALELAPGDAHVLFNVARAEYEMGHIAAARGRLEQALSEAPNFAVAQNFLAFLNSSV